MMNTLDCQTQTTATRTMPEGTAEKTLQEVPEEEPRGSEGTLEVRSEVDPSKGTATGSQSATC